MPLAPGARLGAFEIVAAIGAGGMGEVYRARDTKLQREVALKVLPDSLADDADRLARFAREATTLASLNHPNIAHVYGIEDSGATRALVMELVDGEDLAQLLARRALRLKDALPIARQIAEALAAAHQAGIVHRDLKPANIRIRPDGEVKVLDFGLAKPAAIAEGHEGSHAELEAATITSPAMTQAGMILGTAAYMAPEQAKGRTVDRRADIWAFGCVVFEMLARKRAFSGDSVTDVLASVLTREPDWTALPEFTPDSIRRLLRRCLQKDPRQRLHDLADARLEIDDAIATPALTIERRGRPRWALGAIAVLLVALAAALATLATLSPAAPETTRAVLRPQRLTDMTGLEETPALSPDGRSVAFTAGVKGRRQIYIQLLAGGGEPLPITHDDRDHQFPRWTPMSTSVVYFSPATPGDRQGTLYEIPALGGAPPRRVVDSMGSGDIRASDSRLAYFRLAAGEIQLVTGLLDGSSDNVVAKFEPSSYYLYPRWSPDGQWIAYQRGNGNIWNIFIVQSSGGEPRQLTNEDTTINGFAWLPDSTGLLYSSARGETMLYLPTMRLWQVAVSDGAVQQMTSGETSYLHPDIATNGDVIASRLHLESDIWRFPTDGTPLVNVQKAVRITNQTGQVQTPTVSPGDREVAFLSDRGGHANLWAINLESGVLRQITHERDPDVIIGVPVWSPTNNTIAFVSSRGRTTASEFGIWLVNADGSNLRKLVPGVSPTWSADGHSVYFATTSAQDLYKVSEGGTPVTLRSGGFRNIIGSDGTTMYMTVERRIVDGLPELEIRSASPEDAPTRILAKVSPSRVPYAQIFNPTLSPDGKWIVAPLTDGFSTNVWTLSTSTGEWRQITDFGGRPTFIARKVSWSSDGRSVFAAVAEGDADIVLLDGLLSAWRN